MIRVTGYGILSASKMEKIAECLGVKFTDGIKKGMFKGLKQIGNMRAKTNKKLAEQCFQLIEMGFGDKEILVNAKDSDGFPAFEVN